MRKIVLSSLVILSILTFSGCTKKSWDEIYARPEWLEQPIYQQLQAKGRFSQLLTVIDKSGYKTTLSGAGYWTMFAPNDAAFTKSGINVANLDSSQALNIIKYLLAYNSFTKERLDDYQANTGWKTDFAFKRRTAYYTGFYDDIDAVTGQKVKALATNRNNTNYVAADNNNKYIPFFTNEYFAAKNLTAADYTYFYPNSQFGGFNVAEAKVAEKDIVAENGTIHELDNVVLALPSLDEYIRTKPEYSLFKSLMDKYMVSFVPNSDATRRYQILTSKTDPVYIKTYSSLLAFAPNNENYLKLEDNDGQKDGFSMFVPKNDVLQNYINTVILENFTSFDKLPPRVMADLINAHLWQTTVWPSKFNNTFNFLSEEARFSPTADIIDKKILSNGFFYGTSKVQEANVFSTVYARSYLDPGYNIMTTLLDADLRYSITNPKLKYTVFMISDKVLLANGYNFDAAKNEWSWKVGTTTTTGEAIRQRLLRILATSVVPTPKGELDDLSGSGIIDGSNGEYIKWSKNTVWSGGVPLTTPLKVVGSKTSKNGKVYYMDGLLSFTELPIGADIETLGLPTTSQYSMFWNYLKNSTDVYNAATKEILGTSAGTFYTIFVPNNAAMQAAVNAGLLPGTGTGAVKTPNYVPTTPTDKNLVTNFLYYHFLNKKSVIPDGKESGSMETLLKNAVGDPVNVTVLSSPGAMQVTDNTSRKSNVVVAQSNNLSNRAVIHLIDNYLKY